MYIQVENGVTVNHPAVQLNLLYAFGEIPSNWKPFNRTLFSESGITLGVYQKANSTYVLSDDGVTWQDSWFAEDMTEEEITYKQNLTITTWANRPYANNFTAWTLDTETCTMVPPHPRPTPPEGLAYRWNGKINDWQIAPHAPDDGQNYNWNFDTWEWELVS